MTELIVSTSALWPPAASQVRWVLLVCVLLIGGSASQIPPIITPVIVPSVQASEPIITPAELHIDSSLEHAGSRPEYAFAYGVDDPQSGNAQSHQEERDGDNVRGQYKVLEADGSVRTVTYTVDPKNGFQANVQQSEPSLSAAYKDQTKTQADIPSTIPEASEPIIDFFGYHGSYD